MPSPFFSIILPTNNSARTLQNALDSIYRQSYRDVEIMIVDNLSKDGTIEIIEENCRLNTGTRFISEKDQGVYDAFNKGLQVTTGKWVYFLGSDDHLHNSSVLQEVFEKLRETEFDLLYGNVLFSNSKKPYDGQFDSEKLLEQNISHQAIFYNRRVFEKLGGFKIQYKIMGDWEFNLRCFFQTGFNDIYLDLVIADFAIEGISRQMDVLFLREVLIHEKLQRMNKPDAEKYLRNLSRYDSCWRLLRNAKVRTTEELLTLSKEQPVPKALMNMLDHQRRISPGLLQNGYFSKSCMFISFLLNQAKRAE
jgi:glycosyltransferase involved in cell wall biosynthesis